MKGREEGRGKAKILEGKELGRTRGKERQRGGGIGKERERRRGRLIKMRNRRM